ncbi:MAG: hypothetical protein Q9M28_11460 [Mariprofundaceae bacterium]|nr:hypothetical protein [Mariprofundaceae bacterium]
MLFKYATENRWSPVPLIVQAEYLLQEQFGHIEDGCFCLIGLNQLGGLELSLRTELQLLSIWDSPTPLSSGPTQITAQSYYDKLTRLVIEMMSENTAEGVVWPIDMSLKPQEESGTLCSKLEDLLSHYHHQGQTWERLMLSKARSVAGNLDLGDSFIEQIQDFIYQPYMDYSTI